MIWTMFHVGTKPAAKFWKAGENTRGTGPKCIDTTWTQRLHTEHRGPKHDRSVILRVFGNEIGQVYSKAGEIKSSLIPAKCNVVPG